MTGLIRTTCDYCEIEQSVTVTFKDLTSNFTDTGYVCDNCGCISFVSDPFKLKGDETNG